MVVLVLDYTVVKTTAVQKSKNMHHVCCSLEKNFGRKNDFKNDFF